jgi:DNA-binding NtrC family response regulator
MTVDMGPWVPTSPTEPTSKSVYFEAAEGGVLLLDEIGDTTLEFQVKLLRVLEEGKVTRLGGTEPIRTNVRVICATNRDLEKDCLGELNAKHRLGRKHLTESALGALAGYRWPGNVRELANTIEAAYVTTSDSSIAIEHLPARIRNAQLHPSRDSFKPQSYKVALERFRREYSARMIEHAQGDLQRAARMAGVNPSTFYRNGSRSGRRPR